jgi:dipeptidyl aminopeptidase/acylaminoacyl peptidase
MLRRCAYLLLLLVVPAVVFAETRAMEIDDLFRVKRVAAPAVSPDGTRVVYTVTTVDKEANKTDSDLWLSSLDGKEQRELTNSPAQDRNAVWSPDGKLIAFESTRSGNSQIWLISPDGGEARQLTFISTEASSIVWSPDSRKIAFLSSVFPENSTKPFAESDELNRKKLDELENGKVKAKTITRYFYRHWDSWVDGKRQHIFVQSIDQKEPVDITPGDRDAVPSSSTFSAGTDFSFSPDGKQIAYTAGPVVNEAWNTNFDIYTVPVEGGDPVQVTDNPAADGYPQYSPDGRYVAYRAQTQQGYEADRWQLMLMDRATGTTRSLTTGFEESVGTPVWSPDSKKLYFDAEEKARKPLYVVSINGNDTRKLYEGGVNGDISVSGDGRTIVFTHQTAVQPIEVYRVGFDGRNAAPVTAVNKELLAGLDIPAPESVFYDGADGAKVQAWIFRPPKFDANKKYPLLLLVHGGPQGSWEDAWHYRWLLPLWAAQGYVVIAPNPRGSTGFGEEFKKEISGDWGGKVFVDVMKAVDYAEKLPYVDPDRKAAAGASYGGYMIYWIAGNAPQRFRCLIAHDGAFNLTSEYGTTDEIWFDEWEHGGTPWDNPEEFEKYSPHRFAANWKTPMLIVHSEGDFRLSVTEGMQAFAVLQRLGIPSKFLYFPDETHFVQEPLNSELWHKTIFDWLAQYLK